LPKEVLGIQADNTLSCVLFFYQVLYLSINVGIFPELRFIAHILIEALISRGYNA
jgi:hypothetical protein